MAWSFLVAEARAAGETISDMSMCLKRWVAGLDNVLNDRRKAGRVLDGHVETTRTLPALLPIDLTYGEIDVGSWWSKTPPSNSCWRCAGALPGVSSWESKESSVSAVKCVPINVDLASCCGVLKDVCKVSDWSLPLLAFFCLIRLYVLPIARVIQLA